MCSDCCGQSETLRPLQCARSRAGFTLNIIDTPGLVEGGCVNDQALDIIRRYHDSYIKLQTFVDFLCRSDLFVSSSISLRSEAGGGVEYCYFQTFLSD